LFEGGFEVFDDFLSENVRVSEVVGLFEAFVAQPEDIEAGFIAINEFFVVVSAPAAVGSRKESRLFPILDLLAAGRVVTDDAAALTRVAVVLKEEDLAVAVAAVPG
jgi:hypothetical protein